MEFLKELFRDEAMTYTEFEEAVCRSRIKLADLSGGDYVSWKKYESRIKALRENIRALSLQIEQKEYELAAREYLSGYRFSSETARNAVADDFIRKEFKIQNGKFIGADQYIAELKERDPDLFRDHQPRNSAEIRGAYDNYRIRQGIHQNISSAFRARNQSGFFAGGGDGLCCRSCPGGRNHPAIR